MSLPVVPVAFGCCPPCGGFIGYAPQLIISGMSFCPAIGCGAGYSGNPGNGTFVLAQKAPFGQPAFVAYGLPGMLMYGFRDANWNGSGYFVGIAVTCYCDTILLGMVFDGPGDINAFLSAQSTFSSTFVNAITTAACDVVTSACAVSIPNPCFPGLDIQFSNIIAGFGSATFIPS